MIDGPFLGTGAHIAHAQDTRALVRNAHNRIMNFHLVGGGGGEIGTHFASHRVCRVVVPAGNVLWGF